jgi:hypothetical protein
MSTIPASLVPPPPTSNAAIINGIIAANNNQDNMVKLLAGGWKIKRQRKQKGGANPGDTTVEVPKMPVAYNDGGAMQKIFQANVTNSMQSTANAANDTKMAGGLKKSRRNRSRKTKKNKRSKKTKKTKKSKTRTSRK